MSPQDPCDLLSTLGAYSQLEHMECLIQRYSWPLTGRPVAPAPIGTRPGASSVLLTGCTGNLGSDILALLLIDPNVSKVCALNRHSSKGSASARVHAQFVKKNLDVALLQLTKLSFAEGDTALHNLGLEEGQYEEIRTSVTMIIHNAWPINLQADLFFYEPHIRGLRNLIDLGRASESSMPLRFIFISSYFACQSWSTKYTQALPEVVVLDTTTGCGIGYGASKHVAERIVASSGLDASSLRFAQLCGRLSDGQWSAAEWIPMVVSAGIQMGALPTLAGLVPFVPLDMAAKCTLDVAFSSRPLPAILNFSHPRPFRWNLLTDAVNNTIAASFGSPALPVVPLSDWITMAERCRRLKDARHPVLKLLYGFHGLARDSSAILAAGAEDVEHIPKPALCIELATTYSPTLRDLGPISMEDARRWAEYWLSLKFFYPEAQAHPKL